MPKPPFPMSAYEMIQRLSCLPPNMRIKLTQGDKEFYLEDLTVESNDVVSISMIPIENFSEPTNINKVEEEYNG